MKQTYRVLLTRGMKGCYVYFEDAATREFFLSHMKAERASAVVGNPVPHSAGIPGISIPCGVNREGLPIGMQILGKQFDKSAVLRSAHVAERALSRPRS